MELASVVPWGRSLEEYQAMFKLSATDLKKAILGCADGPASFNAELTQFGGRAVSIDPIYQFTLEQIRFRIDEVYPLILSQVADNSDQFVWQNIKDVEQLGEVRMRAMGLFLKDYQKGLSEGRYQCASVQKLPFEDGCFDLALCSHFLFLYSEHVDLDQHLQAFRELTRVATEVRVYPLITLNGEPSSYLDPVIQAMNDAGMSADLVPVDYEFQKGAVEMLVVKSR